MEFYIFAIIVLVGLAVSDLIVGVSNDAVNFLNSSIGSRVAPRYVIMIIASIGMLAGVTFSSGMMEVARKGIFHPQYFLMPEMMTIFLAVMLTDILLLDLFNTFGLPTSTTVSIVFELLGAAVAVSLIKTFASEDSYTAVVTYINTGKALAIISGILLSIIVAFICGAVAQFFSRLFFTFDYEPKMKYLGGIWGGLALSMITYFILIKGAKGTSFLTSEAVDWINNNTLKILSVSFIIFALIFQFLVTFTRINILKIIVLVGTFALAMAFAANDLVNFIGVPMAGWNAYEIAAATDTPFKTTMEALQHPIQSNTFLLLIAGSIMMITLWVSKKSRSVTSTQIDLSSQDEGMERFGSFVLSRIVVGMVASIFDFLNRLVPKNVRIFISKRLDPSAYKPTAVTSGKMPSFDLLRASVNLMMASAVVAYATSLKLPLSTTYVTFMVAMGASLADQAWGRESAVYRVTGVMTVVGGWFCTAFIAFTVSFIFANLLHYFGLFALVSLVLLAALLIFRSFRYHSKREEEKGGIAALSLKDDLDAAYAVNTAFEQTGHFLNEVSWSLRACFDGLSAEDRQRLRIIRNQIKNLQTITNIIIANIFKTLYMLDKENAEHPRRYTMTVGALQEITESHRDIIMRAFHHTINFHSGLLEDQKEELRRVRIYVSRLLENTAIMLLKRKKIDYDYIENQCEKLTNLIQELDQKQIKRIQSAESKTRLSILYYSFLENSEKISTHTRILLDIFRDYFLIENNKKTS